MTRPVPRVRIGDLVLIGDSYGVATLSRPPGSERGDIQVVCDPQSPKVTNAKWDGERWVFVKHNQSTRDATGPRYKALVTKLKTTLL